MNIENTHVMRSNVSQADSMRLTIVGPRFFSYVDAVVGHIRELGISAQSVDERGSQSFFVKAAFRSAFLRKLFFFLIRKRHESIIREVADFKSSHVLFISPESVNKSLITSLKALGVKTYLYMWDSFDNKPAAKSCLSDFDNVATFDPVDADTNRLSLINLFAEDEFFSHGSEGTRREFDLSFVGTAHSSRPKVITSLVASSSLSRLRKKIHLYQGNAYYYLRARLLTRFSAFTPLSNHSISKSEVAEIFKSSKFILDVTHADQRGLTSRSFEALAAGGVLVTNNRWSKELLPAFSERIVIFKNISDLDIDKLKWSESADLDHEILTLKRFCNEILRLTQN